ncbi:MAG TPA: hypothetical protein VD969_15505 [Symbiobacteriaceae bacterium]|nr:hypothetical protein [Symbiobacteriaceae bacterium]
MTVALGALLIMLLAAATLAVQTKHALRLSRAEPEAAQVEQLIVAEFTKAAAKAHAAATQSMIWPDEFGEWVERDAAPCQPNQRLIPSSNPLSKPYPLYCTQALKRTAVNGTAPSGPYYYQVQVRVRYQAYAGAEISTKYGWVITRAPNKVATPTLWRIYYLHDWCTKQFPVGATAPSCLDEG